MGVGLDLAAGSKKDNTLRPILPHFVNLKFKILKIRTQCNFHLIFGFGETRSLHIVQTKSISNTFNLPDVLNKGVCCDKMNLCRSDLCEGKNYVKDCHLSKEYSRGEAFVGCSDG